MEGRQQPLGLLPQFAVLAGVLVQVRRPVACRLLEHGVEQFSNLMPALRRHALAPFAISRCSHARAELQYRFTVAVETRVTSDVSSTERPPKNRSSTMRPCNGSIRVNRSSASSMASTSMARFSDAVRVSFNS